MQPIHLLDLASRKSTWLAARQSTVAANIANINTPGYRGKDVASFSDTMAQTHLEMASTNAAHLSLAGGAGGAAAPSEQPDNFEVTDTGNSVGLEQEMAKAGDVNRDYALTTNIVRSFHSMFMSALKG